MSVIWTHGGVSQFDSSIKSKIVIWDQNTVATDCFPFIYFFQTNHIWLLFSAYMSCFVAYKGGIKLFLGGNNYVFFLVLVFFKYILFVLYNRPRKFGIADLKVKKIYLHVGLGYMCT